MAKTKTARYLRWILFLAISGGGIWGGWVYFFQKKEVPWEYQTIPVRIGDLTQAVTATGAINPVLNVQVGSQVSGNIQKLYADWNSRVKAGQVVAQIDPSNYRASVMQAKGDLANAKAALELAQVQLARTQSLRLKDSTPQASLDQALATVHQAEAVVETKQGSLALAQANLDHCTISSPVDGVVISRSVDVGQTVAASLNAPVIFTIANDLAKMQIDSNVAEADVGMVHEGQDVEFTVDAYPYRTFKGKVRQVRNAPITVSNVVTYDAVIDVDNGDLKLMPGMTANVSIIVSKRNQVTLISNAAMRFKMPEDTKPDPGLAVPQRFSGPGVRPPMAAKKAARKTNRSVWILAPGAVAPVETTIKTGISDGVETEVLEGVKEGDPAVTYASQGAAAGRAGAGSGGSPFGGPMMQRKF